MRRVLVTGGAGYVGSHVVWALRDAGYFVVVLDDMSNGSRRVIGDTPLVVEDYAVPWLDDILGDHKIDVVVHCAALASAPQSVEDPALYMRWNVSKLIEMATVLRDTGTPVVFSSSAAVYGRLAAPRIDEGSEKKPVNPYGMTKLIGEQVLRTMCKAVCLRYFNVAGADPKGRTGQTYRNGSLFQCIQHALETGKPIKVYGNMFDTRDGTPMRDFIHPSDLADAHVRAVSYLVSGGNAFTANVSCGRGFTVLEVIREFERVSGVSLDVVIEGPRAGDIPTSVGNAARARDILGWRPVLDDLRHLVETANRWDLNPLTKADREAKAQ